MPPIVREHVYERLWERERERVRPYSLFGRNLSYHCPTCVRVGGCVIVFDPNHKCSRFEWQGSHKSYSTCANNRSMYACNGQFLQLFSMEFLWKLGKIVWTKNHFSFENPLKEEEQTYLKPMNKFAFYIICFVRFSHNILIFIKWIRCHLTLSAVTPSTQNANSIGVSSSEILKISDACGNSNINYTWKTAGFSSENIV